ncbi:hypothetical protein AFAEC_0697 [Aliarcobacter faecis]|uniref:hypothetical protein n=1 Tax=Aliarcobacter faecis TaxID=1564138 RepID=UPI00047CB114|nr:hypothetical protein [Aliarcobacter faecis]QKF72879.1 hypothetical protein AFAEC_0697 [Aliarcobacter faecis]
MKTLTLKVQDGFIDDFLNIIEKYQDKIQIQKDKNLELDPYFYERQKSLHKIKEDIENGSIKMIEHKDIWSNIKNHLNSIENI